MIVDQVAQTRGLRPDGAIELLRSIHGTTALALLGERGLDPADVVRFAFGRRLRIAIDSVLARASKETAHGAFARWIELRKPLESGGLDLSEPFRARLRAWIDTSEPAEALSWTPPSAEEWGSLDVDGPQSERLPELRWLAERLTLTYLRDWSDRSLALEYAVLESGYSPKYFPDELLAERKVPRIALDAELAHRRVRGVSLDMEAISSLVDAAKEAIDEGKPAAAAAIFAAARTLNPADALLINNHGFALLPDDPSGARKVLGEARTLMNTVIVEANDAVACLLLDSQEAALAACERAYEIGLESAAIAWMWDIPISVPPKLVQVHTGIYTCDVAVFAARDIGRDDLVALWKDRAAVLAATLEF